MLILLLIEANEDTIAAIRAAKVKPKRPFGNKDIIGVMIESHLKEGNQKISENMEYGKSITDACINWEETKKLLNDLAQAVKARR